MKTYSEGIFRVPYETGQHFHVFKQSLPNPTPDFTATLQIHGLYVVCCAGGLRTEGAFGDTADSSIVYIGHEDSVQSPDSFVHDLRGRVSREVEQWNQRVWVVCLSGGFGLEGDNDLQRAEFRLRRARGLLAA